MAQVVLSLHVELPWWWRPYMWAAQFMDFWNLVEIDSEVVADCIARHIRLYTVDGRGHRRRVR